MLQRRTQVRFDHARIAHGVRGGAAEDRLAGGDHDDVLGDRHQHFHHVLDHQHRHAAREDAPQQIDRIVRLGRRQARHHLVEQQQRGLRRERARDLQPLLVGDRQRAAEPIALVREPDEREHFLRVRDRVGQPRMVQQRAGRRRFEHRHVRERLHDLVRAPDPQRGDAVICEPGDLRAAKAHAARARLLRAGDARERRRLARAVRPDQPRQRAFRDVQIDAVERAQRAESLRQAAHFKQRVHLPRRGATVAPRRRRSASTIVPTMPYGRSAAITQMIAP